MLLLESKDFREFIALLNSHRVKFLIVGGHAVMFHGHPRYTGDLDVWVATDPDNAARVEQAVKDFGFGKLFKAGDFSKPGYAIQMGRPPYRIDILIFRESIGTRLDGMWPESFADVNHLRTAERHDVDHGEPSNVRSKRKKLGSVFQKYSGNTTPETLAPEEFEIVQARLLTALEKDIRGLRLAGLSKKTLGT